MHPRQQTNKSNMKSTFSDLRRLMLPASVMMILLPACNKNRGYPPPSTAKCHLQTEVDSFATTTYYPGVTCEHTEKKGFTYDPPGNWTGSTDSNFLRYSDGMSALVVNTDTRTYDGSGYLIREALTTHTQDRSGVITNSDQQIEYQYENGRLVKRNDIFSDQTGSSVRTYTYAYDPFGNLIFYTAPWDTAAYIYTNGALTRIDEKNNQKQSNVFTIKTDARGAILKLATDNGNGKDCKYDANGNLVELQEWEGGTEAYLFAYAYDNRKNPTSFEAAQNKGFPRSQYIAPYNYIIPFPVNNFTSSSFKAIPPKLQPAPFESNYINSYDGEGNLSVQVLSVTMGTASNLQPVKIVYSYTGCP